MLVEVDKQSEVESGSLEIVVDLGSVLIGQDGQSFVNDLCHDLSLFVLFVLFVVFLS